MLVDYKLVEAATGFHTSTHAVASALPKSANPYTAAEEAALAALQAQGGETASLGSGAAVAGTAEADVPEGVLDGSLTAASASRASALLKHLMEADFEQLAADAEAEAEAEERLHAHERSLQLLQEQERDGTVRGVAGGGGVACTATVALECPGLVWCSGSRTRAKVLRHSTPPLTHHARCHPHGAGSAAAAVAARAGAVA